MKISQEIRDMAAAEPTAPAASGEPVTIQLR
jgi:hypothetical protein